MKAARYLNSVIFSISLSIRTAYLLKRMFRKDGLCLLTLNVFQIEMC